MISAEDFGNVCDRSTEALLSRGSESLQKDNSASVTLSLCIGNAKRHFAGKARSHARYRKTPLTPALFPVRKQGNN